MATPKNNSVIKAFDILRLIARAARPLSPQQIADDTGGNLSTTHRFLLTLEEIGAVARRPGNLYSLGMLVSELGRSAGRDQILTERARALIELLSEDLGETVGLTLFRNNDAQMVAWHQPKRALVCSAHGNPNAPFHLTAVGKLYLSSLAMMECEERLSLLKLQPVTPHSVAGISDLRQQLRDIRDTGLAVNWQETEVGMVELALPITSAQGETIGALSVSAPVSRMEPAQRTATAAAMRRTIEAINARVFVKSYTVPGKARPRGSFPHVKRAGPLVFVSGTSSRRPDDSFAGTTVFPDGSIFHDTYEQTREALVNVADILGLLALRVEDILNLEAFLTNIEDEAQFHQALEVIFAPHAIPPTTVVAASALPHPHQAVMIKAVAHAGALRG